MTVAGMFKSSSSIMKDYGGAPGSCNDYTENGIRFVYGGNATDYPINNPYGILITNKTYYPALQSTYINQTFVRNINRGIYTRFKEGQNDWTDWVRADNFGYNTLEELASALKPKLGLS